MCTQAEITITQEVKSILKNAHDLFKNRQFMSIENDSDQQLYRYPLRVEKGCRGQPLSQKKKKKNPFLYWSRWKN